MAMVGERSGAGWGKKRHQWGEGAAPMGERSGTGGGKERRRCGKGAAPVWERSGAGWGKEWHLIPGRKTTCIATIQF
ncbi:hypothetical protein LINPERHAP1_LOCUS12257 [Linum perenne]